MKLYTDIDGVLLGKSRETGLPTLANHAEHYIEYCLANFETYWLTTHCRGSVDMPLDYLAPYCTSNMLTLLQKLKPTDFKTFKTEALSGDFIWVDDQPTAYEMMVLQQNNWLHRWYQVNTRKNFDELSLLINALKKLKAE